MFWRTRAGLKVSVNAAFRAKSFTIDPTHRRLGQFEHKRVANQGFKVENLAFKGVRLARYRLRFEEFVDADEHRSARRLQAPCTFRGPPGAYSSASNNALGNTLQLQLDCYLGIRRNPGRTNAEIVERDRLADAALRTESLEQIADVEP